MGITFLAAGTSVPEAVSSVIVAKQGTYYLIRAFQTKPHEFIFFLVRHIIMAILTQADLHQDLMSGRFHFRTWIDGYQ